MLMSFYIITLISYVQTVLFLVLQLRHGDVFMISLYIEILESDRQTEGRYKIRNQYLHEKWLHSHLLYPTNAIIICILVHIYKKDEWFLLYPKKSVGGPYEN